MTYAIDATETSNRELTGAELDMVQGGIDAKTALYAAACLTCPAFLAGAIVGWAITAGEV